MKHTSTITVVAPNVFNLKERVQKAADLIKGAEIAEEKMEEQIVIDLLNLAGIQIKHKIEEE